MRHDTTKGRCTSFVSTKIYTVYIVDKKISKLSQGLWRFGKILESMASIAKFPSSFPNMMRDLLKYEEFIGLSTT